MKMIDLAKFEVRISVTANDPARESQVVNAIAAQFLKMGVQKVTVIADDQQIDYVDNEVHEASPANIFRSDPLSPIDMHVVGNRHRS
jgi:hypothetical protein